MAEKVMKKRGGRIIESQKVTAIFFWRQEGEMKTILLVGYEPERSSIVDILNRFGYGVIAMQDGPSALSALSKGAPIDLVITDYRIDGMDGLELLDSLKKLAPSVPSIILTDDGSIETYLKALSLGVFEYLNKPAKTSELGRIVQKALTRTQTFEY
jgi:DNA-binding NtrC family response regulator